MSDNTSSFYKPTVATSEPITRSKFIRKTYLHLVAAILGFVAVSTVLFYSGISLAITNLAFSTSFSWLIVMVAFIGVSYLADSWAKNSTSKGMQYLGLSVYVVAESLVFAPLLMIAAFYAGFQLIGLAAFLTLFLTAALTFLVFFNQADFSFLRSFLALGGIISLGIIVLSLIFGFSLGLWFSGAMVLFAGAAILYDTSNVLHHYDTEQYVAASLSLFASVALLFYYILSFLLRFTKN
ncbi:MAG: Bax inhibitor-1 family protein [bacterium]